MFWLFKTCNFNSIKRRIDPIKVSADPIDGNTFSDVQALPNKNLNVCSIPRGTVDFFIAYIRPIYTILH
uniref:Uncharacterized protein n=1 Tax=Meloidogyne incognita TaxID=6306 RepID=A0A914MBY7_MELIC